MLKKNLKIKSLTDNRLIIRSTKPGCYFMTGSILWIFYLAIGIIPITKCISGEMQGKENVHYSDKKPVKTICLVKDARHEAVIVVSENAGKVVKESANLLASYIFSSTKVKFPVEKESIKTHLVRIHVGYDDYVKSLDLGVDKLDSDGFITAFPDKKNIVIVGKTDWGTEFGVYDFLETHLGVRWLFPGKLGEYVPQVRRLEISPENTRKAPVFFSRLLSTQQFWGGKRDNDVAKWAYRNRMHGQIRFHHNLHRLFPPSKYAKTHPAFFPVYGGKRFIPPNDKTQRWQPNFSADGIVREAVKNICAYFKKYPKSTSYSLGINDSVCFMPTPSKKNYLGIDDYSDYYYKWANKVVEGVLKHYPDKWFGCLAYNCVAEPPAFRVNPRIIPFICYDRMKWLNPDIASMDKAITKQWHKNVPTIGWYDYIYGDQKYFVPRVYFHLMADYLRWGSKNGVRCYYAEMYPDKAWIEGPKFYLTLKLLWNPDIDVDKVLKDWYRCAVGEKAQPYLEEYFNFWNDFWVTKVPRTDWFKDNGKRTYLPFSTKGYLLALKEDDLARCEALLNKVVANAETDKQKERARFFMSGFKEIKEKTTEYLIAIKMSQSPPAKQILLFSDNFSNAEKKQLQEEMPKGWSHWQRASSKALFAWDRMVGYKQSGSIRIDVKNVPNSSLKIPLACVLKTCPVQKGNIYHARCWIKTEGLSEETDVGILFGWRDKNNKQLPWESRRRTWLKSISDGQWQRVDIYSSVPKGAVKLIYMLSVENGSQGKVWFDDACLYKVKIVR